MATDVQIYTIPECAELFRVSKNTIYRLIKDGLLEPVPIRGKYRVRKAALERYLDNATRLHRESLVRF